MKYRVDERAVSAHQNILQRIYDEAEDLTDSLELARGCLGAALQLLPPDITVAAVVTAADRSLADCAGRVNRIARLTMDEAV